VRCLQLRAMAKPTRESSLSQTRINHHNHFHLHNNRIPYHEKAHLELRQEPVTPVGVIDEIVTEVVKTVSLVQVVDSAGLPLEVKTIFSPADSPAVSIDVPVVSDDSATVPTLDLTTLLPTELPTDGVPQPTTTSPTTAVESFTSQELTLTSAPSTSSSAFATLSGPFNSTNRGCRVRLLFWDVVR
jgi:hypothetical protein